MAMLMVWWFLVGLYAALVIVFISPTPIRNAPLALLDALVLLLFIGMAIRQRRRLKRRVLEA